MKMVTPIRVFLALGMALLQLQSGRCAGVVAECTESNLRAVLAGGGTVTFACDGTIFLSDTITITNNTSLDAAGHEMTISGNGAVRVFLIGTNVQFSANNLIISNGFGTNGAGILNAGGVVYFTNSIFCGNTVFAAAAPPWAFVGGQSVSGGAIANQGTLQLMNSAFSNNLAIGGAGGTAYGGMMGPPGGTGAGAAIWNSGFLVVNGCLFASNSAVGGRGGTGSSGSWLPGLTHGYPGGPGGDGIGVLFNSGTAFLVNCTLAFNTSTAGAGGLGGPGYWISPDYPPGEPGANGMPGLNVGGIEDVSGQCFLTNCTVAFNFGTGISTVATNGTALVNTLLSENLPGGNGSGGLTDLGHNLSSDTACAFTNVDSLNNVYPLLGPLNTNGGSTLTMALPQGSRAIDSGDTAAAPNTDQRGVARPFGSAADIGAYEFNEATNPGPTAVVTECTEANLRAAMSGGGHVTFTCDGIIPLSSAVVVTTNTWLDAANHVITIQGDSIRIFQVTSNVSFSMANLIITGGNAFAGAAVQNTGGLLTLSNCVFSGNIATRGAAVQNQSGQGYFYGCVFSNNHVLPASGNPGDSAWGGAVDNSGILTADLCIFASNSASGTDGLPGTWYGYPGGSGGSALGGAIYNSQIMTVNRSTFTNNYVIAGNGGAGHDGPHGDLNYYGGAGGPGGQAGRAEGGAIHNAGSARIVDSTFAFNRAISGNGGAGGAGGSAYGSGGGGAGGAGGSAGAAAAGAFSSGELQLVNCTFAFNSGSSGFGGSGGAGGIGGGGYLNGADGNDGAGGAAIGALCAPLAPCVVTNCTFAANAAMNRAGGLSDSGSGGVELADGKLVNTLLTANSPENGAGSIIDLGHNLSSDASCAFANVGSMNNTDPKLGTLRNNGGPTLTMALLPGSPAIDAGNDSATTASDQRGLPRPIGPAVDIGTFEYGSPALLTLVPNIGGGLDVFISGKPAQACWLLVSENLRDWQPVCTNQFDQHGSMLFHDGNAVTKQKFYRVLLP